MGVSPWTTRFRRTFFTRQSDRERLLTDVDSLETAAAHYAHARWSRERFDQLLENARCQARRGDISSGYELLHIAERYSIHGMPEVELKARAISLQHEISQKLKTHWRGIAGTETLKAGELLECAGPPPSLLTRVADSLRTRSFGRSHDEKLACWRAALAEAVTHRNTSDRNSHRKTDRLRMQVTVIGVFLFLQVAGLAFGAYNGWFDLAATKPENHLLPVCAALGLLGGTLSCAMFVNGFDRAQPFQEMNNAWIISLARAFIGAAMSIPVFLVVSAKSVPLLDGTLQPQGILLLCFLAGFSERWFLHIVPTSPPAKQAEAAAKAKP